MLPDDVALKVDVNQAWRDAATTRAVLDAVEVDIAVLEQPVPPENITDLARIRDHIAVPVMPDESVKTATDASNLIRQQAGDIYNIKLMKTGGLHEATRLNTVAEAAHRPTQLGSNVEGDVGTAAGIHFVTAHDNVTMNELVGPFMTTESITDLSTSKPELETNGPGLGVTINRDTLAELRTQKTTIE
jgi:L-alanine-DL-glutamate epimerase-like enolase superfamily enzyme